MPHFDDAGPRRAFRFSVRRTRLACGLVLFTYVTLHFANHALGNISVDAMERGLALQKLIWQSAPGAIILYAALLTHMGLGFWALYERRQFRFTRMEATQLALGLAIPFLLADHVVGTRVALSLFGTNKGYAEELLKFFVRSPLAGFLQTVLLLIVWIHGCIGLNQFLTAVSGAVIAAGGEPNQILGDGLLALFGLRNRPEEACRQGVAACAAIAANVEKLNGALAHGPVDPIRFGIGIHAGLIIAGDIGYERHAQFTVIGDPVNVAARLQDLTKSLGCEVLMSEDVYAQAGFGPDDLPAHEVDARGREATVKVRSAARAAELARLGAVPGQDKS